MRKILVLRGGALGDFIVTLPALALLRRRWPDARVELIGNATAAQLAQANGLLDIAHSQHEARWAALFGRAQLPADFTTWLASFDLVLNFWPDPDGELRQRFPLHAGQIFLAAPAMPERAPAAAHYCEPLRALGLEPSEFFVTLSQITPRPASDFSRIAIHPGSGSSKKNWPLERWIELCAWLTRAHRADLLIVTGEAESDSARALKRFGRFAHDLPLADLAVRLSQCRLFLGHDSGISHLAAACGVPCILLFGPTDPAMWAPPAPHVRVIKCGGEMTSISVEDVRALL